jgi:hypothetical protein
VNKVLEAVERILRDKPLCPTQRFILCQSWLGKTYSEMAKDSGYGSNYIKEIGSQLWQDLSDAVGERVTKKNLRLVFRRYEHNESIQDKEIPIWQPEIEVRAEDSTQNSTVDFPSYVTLSNISFPGTPVPLDSHLYINRPPVEELIYAEITQPSCLIRIKAPKKMGKSSLLNRIIAHAKKQNYQTVCLDFQEADEAIFVSLDKFLRWFCINTTRQLNLPLNLDNYWDEDMGSKVSCKIYFDSYILSQINRPIVLVLNEVQRIFEHSNIAKDFLPMLRFWHEVARQNQKWEKLRLIVVHTTEIYVPLKLNHSPFNVGLTTTLPPFTTEQIQSLALCYGLDWAVNELGMQWISSLQKMVGGHPYLLSLAFYYLSQNKITLEDLLQTAATPTGIYNQHLREILTLIQAEPELVSSLQQVVNAPGQVQLDAIAGYKLESMGLVELDGNQTSISCELYRLYFSQQLGQNTTRTSIKLLEQK